MTNIASTLGILTAHSIADVCAVARASRTTVYEAIRAGALVARKRGRSTVILSDDLRRWLESLPVVSPNPKS